MKLHDLKPADGSRSSRKRLGRGSGSGQGRTAGRGDKGQKSRSGYSRKRGFEGGQMPLHRRLPKRGFTNIFRQEWAVLNVSRLAELPAGTEITPESLRAMGWLTGTPKPLKILGDGELGVKISVKAHRFSRTAAEKIKAAGGSVDLLEMKRRGPEPRINPRSLRAARVVKVVDSDSASTKETEA